MVGLAITHALARRFPDKSTYLVERHQRPGEETSSRNSEVIHAGLYYPPASLKTNLCLRGRELLYSFCKAHNVPHQQTGKLVVGTADSKEYLQSIVDHVDSLQMTEGNLGAMISGPRSRPPLRIITGDEARQLEPDLGQDVGWTLESPRTGIVDSHELMATLERLALDSESAEIVYDTSVVGILPVQPSVGSGKRGVDESMQGWIVETQTEGGEVDRLLARHVINASGLNGPAMLNSLVRDGYFGSSAGSRSMIGAWYSKGNYASYSRAKGGVSNVQRLIYPLPDMGGSKDKHSHQGLGTHLTLDLDGNIRFGPDTDWLRPPNDANQQTDWWSRSMVALQPSPATANQMSEEERLDAMHASVTSFLPNIRREGLSPDYAGIRPKLVGPGGGFSDFTLLYHSALQLDRQSAWQNAFDLQRIDGSKRNPREALFSGPHVDTQPSLITLCGIESPGLTSSLALAEVVSDLIARRGWGAKMGVSPVPKGAQNEDPGLLDHWA